MNEKMTNQTKSFLLLGICLLVFLVFILFWNSSPNMPIPRFVEQNVVLATGAGFDSKKLIVLNPRTSKEIQPCIPITTYPSNEKNLTRSTDMKNNTQKCDTELNIDSNPVIASALESSQNPIKGKIKNKKGEIVEAQYIVTVEALFEGSDCSTIGSSGRQFEGCIPEAGPADEN